MPEMTARAELNVRAEAFCNAFAKNPVGAAAYGSAFPESLSRSSKYRAEKARRMLRRPAIVRRLREINAAPPHRLDLLEERAARDHDSKRRQCGLDQPPSSPETAKVSGPALAEPAPASAVAADPDVAAVANLIAAARALGKGLLVVVTVEIKIEGGHR